MKGRALALAVGFALAGGAVASADPRLDEVVYSPYVERHVVEVETRVGQELGPGDLSGARAVVVEVEAGISDRASLALVSRIVREPGGSDRLTGLGLEGIYYLGQVPKLGVDVGGYLEVAKGLGGESDGLEAKLLLAKTQGRFQGLVNLILERQGAYVGPQVKWEGRPGRLPFDVALDAGWLAPVGLDRREARSQTRLSVEIERRF